MIEYVFRPSRRTDGKRTRSRVYFGRFRVDGDTKVTTIPLNTPDRAVAEKRLRDRVVELQREREGLAPPKLLREAAASPLADLVAEYERDLKALDRATKHVKATTRRLRRMIGEAKWTRLGDIRPDAFIAWRSTLTCSAKTKKEYQVSANAFLNWLVRSEKLATNPLAKVEMIDPRGKAVQESRAFTTDELERLFRVAGRTELVYRLLVYTGMRKEELRATTWGDLQLDGQRATLAIPSSRTKNRKGRNVPLRAELAAMLRGIKPAGASLSDEVFFGWFPTYETLRKHFEAANIPHRDASGRVVHFHAFRKTFQTLGARSGMNQRVAQDILGHSSPLLTAAVYTDVSALGQHDHAALLPWIGATENSAQLSAQKDVPSVQAGSCPVTNGTAAHPAELVDYPLKSPAEAQPVTVGQSGDLVVGGGFEPP